VNLGTIVNGLDWDREPSISSDGLVLFFSSTRTGYIDLWLTSWETEDRVWGEPVNLGPSINTLTAEDGLSISADGQTLYFSDYGDAKRPSGYGGADLWQVAIQPVVDLNGDGVVDAQDMCFIVDHWGEDHSVCDMGPMPWGDGVVDVEDLKVLAEHLFEEVEDPTLVAHWPLDEVQGEIAYNDVDERDGTLIGDPVWQPDSGMVAGSLQLDGIDDCVGTDPVLNPADGPFSVIAWIQGGGPGQVVLSQVDGVNWLTLDAEGKLMTELKSTGRNTGGPLLSEVSITDGYWHRVGLVWDGSHRHLYVDGTEVARDNASQPALKGSGGGLYIGVGKAMEQGTFWAGLIDDVRIYNRAVSP
jgi:hypothetical protein